MGNSSSHSMKKCNKKKKGKNSSNNDEAKIQVISEKSINKSIGVNSNKNQIPNNAPCDVENNVKKFSAEEGFKEVDLIKNPKQSKYELKEEIDKVTNNNIKKSQIEENSFILKKNEENNSKDKIIENLKEEIKRLKNELKFNDEKVGIILETLKDLEKKNDEYREKINDLESPLKKKEEK